MTDPRYPIGKVQFPTQPLTDAERRALIDEIAAAPEHAKHAISGLKKQQLDTPYREGGWTVRQVIHHLVDSHMNAFIRFKFALTEDKPTIKPYNEPAWASTPENTLTPVDSSLALLENLHARWVALLRSLKPEEWSRTIVHPERGEMSLETMLAIYSWHGRHHVAHITELKKAQGWQ